MERRESLIEGRWRIVETELWDQEAFGLVVPAYMRFDRSGLGEIDATSGRAWARIDGDTIRGKLFIHQGDESTFVARRERGAQRGSTSKAPRPPGGAAARTQRGRPRQRGFRDGGRGTGRVPGAALQGWAPATDGWE
jgi:hypothetical protein